MKKIFLSALLLAGVAQAQTIDPSYIFYYQKRLKRKLSSPLTAFPIA